MVTQNMLRTREGEIDLFKEKISDFPPNVSTVAESMKNIMKIIEILIIDEHYYQ